MEDFCRCCDPCTARKGPPGRSHAPLQQFLVGGPMERVAVDVVGPLPRSDKGNRYVLSAIDYFTKWPEAYALPDQEAETVVDALVEGMFSRFGVPETIHSDQGRNFESRVFTTMCERLGARLVQLLCGPRVMGWWRDFTAPWDSNWPFSLHNTSGTGMTICPWCSWRVVLQFKRPHPAPLLSSCWGESSAPRQWWHLAGPQIFWTHPLVLSMPGSFRTAWNQHTVLQGSSSRVLV